MNNNNNLAEDTRDAAIKTTEAVEQAKKAAKTTKKAVKTTKKAAKAAVKAGSKLISTVGWKVIAVAAIVILFLGLLTNAVPSTSFNAFTHQNENQLLEDEKNNRESVRKDLTSAEDSEIDGVNIIASVFKAQKADAYDKLEKICKEENVDFETSLQFLDSNFVEIGSEAFTENDGYYTEEQYDAMLILSAYSISVDNLLSEKNISDDYVSDIKPIGVDKATLSKAQTVYDILVKDGCTPEAACGILGNLVCESSLIANNTSSDGHSSYGIAQWTGDRKTKLKNFCKKKGYSYSSLEGQAHYLVHEINTGEGFSKLSKCNWSGDLSYLRCSNVIPGYSHPGLKSKQIKSMTSIEKVAVIWINHHERPKDGIYHNEEKRIAYAKGFYERFANSAATEIEKSSPSGSVTIGVSKDAKEVIEFARTQVGKGDIYTAAAKKEGHGTAAGWCGRFVWYCFHKTGNDFAYYYKSKDNFSGNPTKVKNWAEKEGRIISKEQVRPGDLFVNITSDNHHIGLIEYIDKSGKIHTIERYGDKVKKRTRKKVNYFIRPAYNESITAIVKLPADARASAGSALDLTAGNTESGKKHWTQDMNDKLSEYLEGIDLYTIEADVDENGEIQKYDGVVDKNATDDLSDDLKEYDKSVKKDEIETEDSKNSSGNNYVGIVDKNAIDEYKNSEAYQQQQAQEAKKEEAKLTKTQYIHAEMKKEGVEDIAMNAFNLTDEQVKAVYGEKNSYTGPEIIREMSYNSLALLHNVTDPEEDMIPSDIASATYNVGPSLGKYKLDYYCGCDKKACVEKRTKLVITTNGKLPTGRKRVKGASCAADTTKLPLGTILELDGYGLLVVDDVLKGTENSDTIAIFLGKNHDKNVQNMVTSLQGKKKQNKKEAKLVTGITQTEARNLGGATGTLTWPTPSTGYITSKFGYRIHPIYGYRKFHTGIDIGAGSGSNIVAADGGKVTLAGWNGGYGKCVIIQHTDKMKTLYGHCSSLLVSKGQQVAKGQTIAKVGSTGNSTGPHLHFEVIVNGDYKDPLKYTKYIKK